MLWICHQFSSAAQLCPTLCDPMIRSTPASLSITNSRSSLKLTSIESVMPSSHLILCRPLLLLPPIPPSISIFSNEFSSLKEPQMSSKVAIPFCIATDSDVCPCHFLFILSSIDIVSVLDFDHSNRCMGFPGGSVVKNLPASAGDTGDMGSIPGSGRCPGRRNGNPLQYSCLENPMDRGAWAGYSTGFAKRQD